MNTIKFLVNKFECFIVQHNEEILWVMENLFDMYDLVLYIVNILIG